MNCTPEEYAETINKLHSLWIPHPGQIRVAKDLISGHTKDLFICAGRSFGKTELMAYLLWRWAMTYPGSENYYFAPYMKQAREILWSSHRVQRFGPSEWLKGAPNNTEMRITFKNGSFIKLDGSDNVEAYRGVKPRGLSVLDELKDFRPEFYEAYDPNRAAYDAPIVMIGTPPDRECQFTDLMREFESNPKKRFFQAPTSTNPHIKKDWLDSKKQEFIAKGEIEVWQREYEAVFVKGGKSKIFPMINRDMHVLEHSDLLRTIYPMRSKCEWYTIADPAASSVCAVLLVAINRYTKKIYLLDEIYETSQADMRVKAIGTTILAKENALYQYGEDEWSRHYDEAESWFANEMQDHFGMNWFPTHKAQNKKANGLSLIKDMLLAGQLVMSSKCEKLFWEMDNYFKDKNGNIPKENDHCIAEDELITTSNGLVKIQDIKKDMFVLTRSGYRTVKKTIYKGIQETIKLTFSDGKELICTSDHKIYSNKYGYVRADSLRYGDTIDTHNEWYQKKLSLMGLYLDAILKALKRVTRTIIGVHHVWLKKLVTCTCTEQFGLNLMVRFQRAFTFTTKTVCSQTILLRILNALVNRTIGKNTPKAVAFEREVTSILDYLKKSDRLQQSGIGQNKVLIGIIPTVKKFLEKKIEVLLIISAKFAQLISWSIVWFLKVADPSFARIIASRNSEEKQDLMTLIEPVYSAKKHSGLISTQKNKPAQEAVLLSIDTIGNRRVYDLTIDGAHEFFASGILVHNCIDCLRYLLAAAGYQVAETKEAKESDNEDILAYKMEDDFPELGEDDFY